MTSVLDISNLTVALPEGGDRPFAVSDLSLSVGAGQCVCLVGESGSGKSVSAQAILGTLPRALKRSGGRISFLGKDLPLEDKAAMQTLRGGRIGMIFQEPSASLDPVMRVGAQLDELLSVHGVASRQERRRRIRELFAAVRLPDPERIYAAYPHQLSGGQAQRIVIAMALALEPALLIADEPTTALDVTTQAEILKLIKDLQTRSGAGLLFITHDLGVVADIADQVLVMQEGKVVEEGTRDAVFSRPTHPYTIKLLKAIPRRQARPEREAGPLVLEAEGIHLTYRPSAGFLKRREIVAVEDVSITLRRGQVHGIVGESGSGKSSLVRCILKLETMDAGRLMIGGEDAGQWRKGMPKPMRKRLQIVLQDPYSALDPRQKIGDAIAEAARVHGASGAEAAAKARELLGMVNLPPQAYERFPHEFSGGQRQRICIARALATDPEILIADEAISALDVSIQAQILKLFRDLQERLGFAMLFVTHDLRVASAICDDITVMWKGRVVEQGRVDDVFDRPRHDYTRQLLDAIPDKGSFATSGLSHLEATP
ncbi:ABC transporter ATP-binding protein [Arsenicitalea aurantiaca]|uniref:ABC transporter ATP-binding protein n=1 Tax=Arsenicitalea aurantiaca TaxID=1783274 RepID=A0A433XM36_9HYPH|nr:ABC transporter ATP-binding protein [Arsenicitalea aurantiaca]RUT35048.1 ABC transporter ATP-binding protein [Arsenicitalea aurantiaca]